MKHDIQIELKGQFRSVQKFSAKTMEIADKHGITVNMVNRRHVKCDGIESNGYFCDERKELSVAVGQPTLDWVSIFVHEAQHMEQYIEQCPEWVACEEVDSTNLVFLWLDDKIELNRQQLTKYIEDVKNVELDCDKRAVKKIKEYDLPLDVSEYTQKSNAYILFYNKMKADRKWYKIGKEPYNLPQIWKNLPETHDIDYSFIPDEVAQEYLKCYGHGHGK